MMGGLGSAPSRSRASILLLVVVVVLVVVVESDSANYLVNFVVNYFDTCSRYGAELTAKFLR